MNYRILLGLFVLGCSGNDFHAGTEPTPTEVDGTNNSNTATDLPPLATDPDLSESNDTSNDSSPSDNAPNEPNEPNEPEAEPPPLTDAGVEIVPLPDANLDPEPLIAPTNIQIESPGSGPRLQFSEDDLLCSDKTFKGYDFFQVDVRVVEDYPDDWRSQYVIACIKSGSDEICATELPTISERDNDYEKCRVAGSGSLRSYGSQGITCDFDIELPDNFLLDHVPEQGFTVLIQTPDRTTVFYEISVDPFSLLCSFRFIDPSNDNNSIQLKP